MRLLCLALLCCAIATTCAFAAPKEAAMTLYVSPIGKDANPGTQAKPFATMIGARDAVRAVKAKGPLPAGGVTVLLRGGVYELSEPILFGDGDSGTEACPIEYRAAPGETVRLVGGRIVTGWQPVKDPAILARMDPAARG